MEFALGGAAACGACIFTNPLEVVKTRFQLQGELQSRGRYTVHYRNVFHAFYAIAKADGILALQKGLVPALYYQLFMNGIRLGTFDTLDKLGLTRNSDGEVSFPKSVGVGATSGCISSFLGSPFYLVKTHLQAQSSSHIAVGHQHSHKGTMQALRKTFAQHGVTGLWRGATASMARTTCGSASQLSTFAKSKSVIDKLGLFEPNSWQNALLASMLSGVVVVCVMTPLDVVSTRLYNQPVDAGGRGIVYRGISDCFLKILKSEGIFGFYKGWSASLLRLGPHTILSLLFWSELRKFYANRSPSTISH